MKVVLKLPRYFGDNMPKYYDTFFKEIGAAKEGNQKPLVDAELAKYNAKLVLSKDKVEYNLIFKNKRSAAQFLLKYDWGFK